MKKRILVLLLLLAILYMTITVSAILPEDGKYRCDSQCAIDADTCRSGCFMSVYHCVAPSSLEYVDQMRYMEVCTAKARDAALPCQESCDSVANACVKSCNTYEAIPYEIRPTRDEFKNIEIGWSKENEDQELHVSKINLNLDKDKMYLSSTDTLSGYATIFLADDEGNEERSGAGYTELPPLFIDVLNLDANQYVRIIGKYNSYSTDFSGNVPFTIEYIGSRLTVEDLSHLSFILRPENAEINSNAPEFTITNDGRPPVIKFFKKRTTIPAWGEAWTTFEVEVDDTQGVEKTYEISSKIPDSILRMDGVEQGRYLTYTTTSNYINFGWYTPKISKDYKLDVVKKVKKVALETAKKAADDLFLDSLKGVAQEKALLTIMPESKDQVEAAYAAVNELGVPVLNTGKDLVKSTIRGEKSGESTYYRWTKNAVNGYSNIEGTIGNYVPTDKIMKIGGKAFRVIPIMKGVSYGLIPLKEWYATVDEIQDVADARIISKNYDLKVKVSSYLGEDQKSVSVPVKGYEQVWVN